MAATSFEFRHRWWIIFFLFWLAFSTYLLDSGNSGALLAQWIARCMGRATTENDYRFVFGAGAVLVLAAALLRTWSTGYLRPDVVRDSRIHTEHLLADGPYRHVRNPLYVGNILMAIGIGLMASPLGIVILIAGMTVIVFRLVLREENELITAQGKSYRRYCATVSRFVPSLRPRVPASGSELRWSPAILLELMIWLMAAAMAAFAITLNQRVFWWIFIGAVATSVLQKSEGPQVH